MPELAAIALAPINMIINYYITNAPTHGDYRIHRLR